MIDPTDEMLDDHEQARRAYWDNLGHDTGEGGMTAAEHERVAQREAMKAALEVVEREYDVRPRGEDCLCGADLGEPWDRIPHRSGSRGCRRAEDLS